MGLNLKFKILGQSLTGRATGKTLTELGKIDRALANVGQRLKRVGRSMRNIGAGLTAGVTAPLGYLAANALRLYDAQIKAEAAVAQALRSTGNAAGFQLSELKALASARQKLTTFGDEDILMNVTAPLLTFTNIGKDLQIFERAQSAIVDMASLLQKDLKSATLQVGKALNDPILGLTALRLAGVQFSKENENLIKSLVAMGDTAGAQLEILKELEKQFGGQAAALANTPLGRINKLRNAWNDFREELGGVIAPALTPLVEKLEALVVRFQELSPVAKRNIVIFGGIAAAAGPLIAALGLLTIALGALLSPIGLVVAGVSALAAAAGWIYSKWGPIKDWFAGLWGDIKTLTGAAWEGIKAKISEYAPQWLKDMWEGVITWFANTWNIVKAVTGQIWGDIKAMFMGEMSPGELIYKWWSGISGWFTDLWPGVVQAFVAGWEAIKAEVSQWPSRMYNIGRDMILSIPRGIKDHRGLLLEQMRDAGVALPKALEDELEMHSPSKVFVRIGRNIMEGLRLGISKGLPGVQTEMTGVANTLATPLANSPITDLLVGLINKTTTFKDYFINSLKQAGDSLLRFALNSAWGKLFNNMNALQGGNFGGGLGGIIGGLISNLFGGGFAPRTSPRPTPRPFAKGTVFSSPTMIGNGAGVMAERGAEGLLPLARIGGDLGVKAVGMGGGGDTHFHFDIDARGSTDPAATEAAVNRAMGKAMPQLLQASGRIAAGKIKEAKRRGAV